MTAIAFDTLAYANKLKESGLDSKISETQANLTAEIFQDLMINQLATKQDLKNLEERINAIVIKAMIASLAILGGLQALFHFLK